MADFDLSVEELRLVACFVADAAEPLIPYYESAHPDDRRPRAAVAAARAFVAGDPRRRRQRAASMDAHRAAAEAGTESARLAAGDAASAAYLHPIAASHQLGHILRADANAARIAEIVDGPSAAERVLELACRRAGPGLVDVLRRYPPPTSASSRTAQLISALDGALRSQ